MSGGNAAVSGDASGLVERLEQVLGRDNVLSDLESRRFFSTDLSWRPGETAAAVIRPDSVDRLSQAVGAVTAAGFSVVPRGGGMSYTTGYVPDREKSVLVDMRSMNRIVEINGDDMYVVVECGVTWKDLHETLAPLGLKTPYWGPLSGMYATVGGALSQNSLFHGSGVNGTVAESVIGLTVVLADGTVATTGSGAHKSGNPFWRHFGPDMTGLFTADTGAFAVKAVAVLRLEKAPSHTEYLSFRFDTLDAMLQAQVEIARLNIA
jgi:D-lactate dehydrogenase (cytochrome)